MAKVEKKKEVKVEEGIPAGMTAKDLSLEKRMQLYQTALKKFDDESSATYGISVSTELKITPQGIIPRMVLVDLLKKNDGEKATPETKEAGTTEEAK